MDDATRSQIRLLVLVILAFLPALALYGFARANIREYERQRQEDQLVRVAELATLEYERLIEDSRQLLAALAEFPEIRAGTGPVCNRRLAGVLRHTPHLTTLSVIGSSGYMTCGSLPVDGELFLGDRAYYLLATTRGQFSVGEYALGRITGKPTVGVAYPIAEGTLRNVENVLAASLDLSDLGRYTLPRALPEYVTFSVLDRSGNVLVRSPAGRNPLGHDSVGGRAPESFPALPERTAAPVLIAGTDLDGVNRLFAVSALSGGSGPARGHVVVGKEEVMLLGEIDAAVQRRLRFLGLAGAALLVLTWLFGHYALLRGAPRPRPATGMRAVS